MNKIKKILCLINVILIIFINVNFNLTIKEKYSMFGRFNNYIYSWIKFCIIQ